MVCATHPEKAAAGACVHCGKLFCSDCLVDIKGRSYCREHVGVAFEAAQASAAPPAQPSIIIQNTNTASASTNGGFGPSPHTKILTLIICIFFGPLGIHRFLVGKIGTGLLWLFTLGFFGLGYIIDIISIATGGFRDGAGRPLS